MLPDRVPNPEPLTYESGALPIALRGPAKFLEEICFYLTRLRNDVFVIVKTNAFGIDGGLLLVGLFHISSKKRLFSAETPPLLSFWKDCYL